MRREVFVRGVGAVSALGLDWPSTAEALARGESAICGWEPSMLRASRARWARPFCGIAEGAEDRRREFALRAARRGLGPGEGRGALQSESGSSWEPSRVARASPRCWRWHRRRGRDAASTTAPLVSGRESWLPVSTRRPCLRRRWLRRSQESSVLAGRASAVPGLFLGRAAIAEGVRAIRRGEVDVALCGGVGADVDPLMLAGFGLLGAFVGPGVSCPFDAASGWLRRGRGGRHARPLG